MTDTVSSRYVMGHTDRERRRLALQASILNPITEQLLRCAGLGAGMRVLDFGCGVGDVSMIAARLVGPGGRVTGLDLDEQALAIARGRAAAQGIGHAEFVRTDLAEFRPERLVDATVGRLILIHTPDPLAMIKAAFAALEPGAIAVFQECDFTILHPAYPRAPLRDRVMELCNAFFCKAAHGGIGTQLYHLAGEAGFEVVDCRAEYPICGGAASSYYEWVAESLRSILPRAEALGLARASELDIDTLADRLRDEALSVRSGSPAPVMIGCIARKPSMAN
jgi:ubiquinone/menaquinone biosynthesis C-methylase UbiE